MRNSRYHNCFADLDRRGEGAFVPFAVLGDPDPNTSLEILRGLVRGGADMLELGIPFSDPVADGPAIQAADLRAAASGTTPAIALEILGQFRVENPNTPVGMLLYANLVQRPGPLSFYRRLARSGADSVLVADLPLEEAGPFRRAARESGVEQVFMATPMTGDDRLAHAVKAGGPYLYVVSRTGVTGKDRYFSGAAGPLLRRIYACGNARTLLGFGIGTPLHVKHALAAGADGAISGSAVVEIIGRHCGGKGLGARSRRAMLDDLVGFVSIMKRATRGR